VSARESKPIAIWFDKFARDHARVAMAVLATAMRYWSVTAAMA